MDSLERFRREKDEFFRSSESSPLTEEQKRGFRGLNYFPANAELDLMLEVREFPHRENVDLQTTSGEVQTYERFGRIRFRVEGQDAELTVFRMAQDFFLPFVDSLAGTETYGAGRYLEPERLPSGRLRVDFNMAYNPYCAYNPRWSCPLTPFENRLQVPIRAGEKIFDDT